MARMKRAAPRKYKSTSSAASSFSKGQKAGYAKMNRLNTAKVAQKRLASSTTYSANFRPQSSSFGPPRITPQWSLFGGIADAIRRATGGR